MVSIDKPASSLNVLERCHIPAWILLKILNRLCEEKIDIKNDKFNKK
jgi:hypothetical protein